MPKVALADTFLDWSKLLGSAAKYADSIPGLRRRLDELAEVSRRAHDLEALRLRLQAERLHTVRQHGKDLATEIRSLLKSAFGRQDEELPAFNVRPRRSRQANPVGRLLHPPPVTDPDAGKGE